LIFSFDGLRDILAHSFSDAIVHLLAAYCANMPSFGVGGDERADKFAPKSGACTDWIIRAHLD